MAYDTGGILMNLKVFLFFAGVMNVLLFVTQSIPILTKLIFLASYLFFAALIATKSGLFVGLLFSFMVTACAALPSLSFLKSTPSSRSSTVCDAGIGGQMICREEP